MACNSSHTNTKQFGHVAAGVVTSGLLILIDYIGVLIPAQKMTLVTPEV